MNMKVESSVKIFPGQPHGWTLRYDGGNATAVKSAEEAHKDMLDWLRTHLTAGPGASSSPNHGLLLLPPTSFFFIFPFLFLLLL